MIGELRLKVDGMQKDLLAQSKRLEEGIQFNDQFHSDLRAAVQVHRYRCQHALLCTRFVFTRECMPHEYQRKEEVKKLTSDGSQRTHVYVHRSSVTGYDTLFCSCWYIGASVVVK